ncbi:MAG: hypothetical protein JKX91_06460 [Rhizobiaceae bacterium]|nr:hypothetical protein [Rhizobiaceae bacterium]
MASLEELLAIQQEVDQPQGQTASIDELMAIQQELDQPDETPGLFEEFIAPVVAPFSEAAAAFNRGALNLAESLTIDPINATLQLAGSDVRVPKLSESKVGQAFTKGEFLEPGIVRDVIQAGGELAAPGAAIGKVTRSIAQGVPVAQTVGSNIARQLSTGTVAADVGLSGVAGAGGRAGEEVGGPIGGAIGSIAAPLAVAVPISAAKSVTSGLLRKAAPSVDELKNTARGIYKSLDDSGVSVSSKSFDDLADDIVITMQKEGADPDLTQKAIAVGNRFNSEKGAPKTLTELDTLRKVAKNAADSLDPSERRLGAITIQKIDDFLDNVVIKDIDNKQAGKAFKSARDLWQRARKAEVLEQAVVDANLQASGLENGLRTQFRQIAKKINRGKLRGFTAEERKAIEKVSMGTNAGNIARFLGKFGILDGVTSRSLTTLGGIGVVGAATSNPVAAAAVPLVGQLSGALAQKMTQNNAAMASAIIRAGRNNRKIITAYTQNVPTNQQKPSELAELFIANKVPVGMIKSKNPLISDAAIIATLARENDKKEEK